MSLHGPAQPLPHMKSTEAPAEEKGSRPIHDAASSGHAAVAELLVGAGSWPNKDSLTFKIKAIRHRDGELHGFSFKSRDSRVFVRRSQRWEWPHTFAPTTGADLDARDKAVSLLPLKMLIRSMLSSSNILMGDRCNPNFQRLSPESGL